MARANAVTVNRTRSCRICEARNGLRGALRDRELGSPVANEWRGTLCLPKVPKSIGDTGYVFFAKLADTETESETGKTVVVISVREALDNRYSVVEEDRTGK